MSALAPSSVERLLVFAPNWLGDAVMALPALDDVRRAFPSARLTVAARAGVASLFELTPAVDEVMRLDWGGQLLALVARRRDLRALRAVGAQVALLLPNAFSSAWLAMRAGVPARWGYAADLRGILLSRAIARPAVRRHQAEYYRHLVRELGVPNGSLEPDLQVPDALVDAARARVGTRGWDGSRPLVVLAPGAAYGTAKQWPPAHFARLITRLVDEARAYCVLVGSRNDLAVTRSIEAQVGEAARASVANLAGETTLHELAGILRLADACVSNDSGAMHLAGAVGAPLVALFGPTRERETAPLTRSGVRAEVLIEHVWCRPCLLRECPIDHRCMERLMPDRVLTTVATLVRAEGHA